MPLVALEGLHIRVICDSCRMRTSELCGKRSLEIVARQNAVTTFQNHGWHFDPTYVETPRLEAIAAREGRGKWYCPECRARRP